MTCRVENSITYKQTYNAENRISNIMKMNGDCVTGTITESWSFSYDGDGNRTGQVYTNIGTGSTLTTLYFMGGAYETTVETSVVKKYYAIAGMTVAMNDGSSLKYLLTDHLGSVVAITDASGSVLSQQRYLPFGQVRTDVGNITQTDFGYTGQRSLGMGLMDYHARLYDSYLNRWTQPDSIVPDPANPQSLDRYSYVNNDPTGLTDPTGHRNCDEDGYGCPDTGGGSYAAWKTYIRAGIDVQNANGLRSRGAVYELVPLLAKIPGYRGNTNPYYTGIGPAKVTDAQMETALGDPINNGHNGYGLGMRKVSCSISCPAGAADQANQDIAEVAMGRRIALRTKSCLINGCSATDIFLTAALAENELINPKEMDTLINGKLFQPRPTSGPVTLQWEKWLTSPGGDPNDLQKNLELIKSFETNVLQQNVPEGVDWDYINGLLGVHQP